MFDVLVFGQKAEPVFTDLSNTSTLILVHQYACPTRLPDVSSHQSHLTHANFIP